MITQIAINVREDKTVKHALDYADERSMKQFTQSLPEFGCLINFVRRQLLHGGFPRTPSSRKSQRNCTMTIQPRTSPN